MAALLFLLRPGALPRLKAPGMTAMIAGVGRTLATYAGLLVWPVTLQVDRLSLAPAQATAALAFATVGLAALGLGVYGATRRGPVGDWSAWTLLFVLPVSNLVPIYPGIATRALFTPEHNLYSPLAGIGVLLGLTGAGLAPRFAKLPRRLFQGSVVVALLLLAHRTSARVNDWHDDQTLFASAAAAGSLSPRVWYNLGNSLMPMAADRPRAIAAYREGVRLAPHDPALWMNLAVALQVEKQLDEAGAAYERAIALAPSALAYENLGTLYMARGDTEAARAAFTAALDLDPTRAKAWQALSAMGRAE